MIRSRSGLSVKVVGYVGMEKPSYRDTSGQLILVRYESDDAKDTPTGCFADSLIDDDAGKEIMAAVASAPTVILDKPALKRAISESKGTL